MAGDFTYYADSHDGRVFFTCWNEGHESCGVFSVEPENAAANIKALEKTRTNRTRRGERFNYQSRKWEKAA